VTNGFPLDPQVLAQLAAASFRPPQAPTMPGFNLQPSLPTRPQETPGLSVRDGLSMLSAGLQALKGMPGSDVIMNAGPQGSGVGGAYTKADAMGMAGLNRDPMDPSYGVPGGLGLKQGGGLGMPDFLTGAWRGITGLFGGGGVTAAPWPAGGYAAGIGADGLGTIGSAGGLGSTGSTFFGGAGGAGASGGSSLAGLGAVAWPAAIAAAIGFGKNTEANHANTPFGDVLLGALAPSATQIFEDPLGMGLPTLLGAPFLTPFTASKEAKAKKPEWSSLFSVGL
jgi:hypothetical protein